MKKEVKKEFPDFFPKDIKELIKKAGGKEQKIVAYRLCRNGKVNRDAFISSYEYNKYVIKKPPYTNRDLFYSSDLGVYSTSCFEEYIYIKRVKNCLAKYTPEQIIAKGIIHPSCGPCSSPSIKNKHIDWWLYKDSNPEDYFEEYKEKED